MSQNGTLTSRIESAVDEGASGVEEIHKAIADLPFEVMERNDLLVERMAELRSMQAESIGAVYDLVRSVNHRVSGLASDLLDPRDSE